MTKIYPKCKASSFAMGIAQFFLLPLDRADSLKKFKLSFRGMPRKDTTKVLLLTMMVLPSLNELSISNNHLGTILDEGETGVSSFSPLEDLIRLQRAKALRDLDIARNELFVGTRSNRLKAGFLCVLRERPWIKIDISGNNLRYVDEESLSSTQTHFLPEKLVRLERDCDEVRGLCGFRRQSQMAEMEQRLRAMEEEKAALEGVRLQLSIESSIVRQKESILQAQLLELRELQAIITDPALTSRILELERQVRNQREDCAKIEARVEQIVLEISEQESIVAREREEIEKMQQYFTIMRESTLHLVLGSRGGEKTRFSGRSESAFEENLRIAQERVRSGIIEKIPTVFIHYAPKMREGEFINFLYEDLIRAGLPPENVFCDRISKDGVSAAPVEDRLKARVEKIKTADWVFLVGSSELKNQYDNRVIVEDDSGFSEIDMIRMRDALIDESGIVLMNQDCDQQSDIFPSSLQHLKARWFAWNYTPGFLGLLKDMGIAEG